MKADNRTNNFKFHVSAIEDEFDSIVSRHDHFANLYKNAYEELKESEKIVVAVFDKIGEEKLTELLGKELAHDFVKIAGIRCDSLELWNCEYCDRQSYSDVAATTIWGGKFCSAKCVDEYTAYKAGSPA